MTDVVAEDQFTRGATYSFALAASSTDASAAICTFMLKKARLGRPGLPPGDAVEEVAEVVGTWVAHIDSADILSPCGWLGTFAATTTVDIPASVYLMDARIEYPGGTVVYVDKVQLTINERVTTGG